MTHIAKRIGKGRYLYRGHQIWCVGYHKPDHSVIWEGYDENLSAIAHGYTLKECKMRIDKLLDKEETTC